jgi:DNA invertase Pin-like site-specific DNA recombinase
MARTRSTEVAPEDRSRQGVRAKSAVGYCRRSTDRQEQSIPDQKKAVEEFATGEGLRVVRWYVDDAISGTSVAGRKAFQQLMADAQRDGCDFGFVIVYDVKRFGRVDNDEAGYYRHILKSHGVEVLYASENFSGDYTDDLLRPVKQWQARQESKDLSKVTIRGLISRQPSGAWMGGVPPHGYDLRYENDRGEFLFILRHMPDATKQMMKENGKVMRKLARGESLNISKRDRAKLIPGDPARIETIRKMFKMYSQEGKGLTAISDWLNRNKVPTARSSGWSEIYCGQWADSTVRAILVNPIYAGDMVWNRRTDARFHKISNGHAIERKQAHGARLEPPAYVRAGSTYSRGQACQRKPAWQRAHHRRLERGTISLHPVGAHSMRSLRQSLSGPDEDQGQAAERRQQSQEPLLRLRRLHRARQQRMRIPACPKREN